MSDPRSPGNQASTNTALQASDASQQSRTKSRRVLACVLCQQRKVKCDRRFPCSNCNRASAQCVPATLVPAQRKRKFAERELLERIQRYEAVLSENEIVFEPLPKASQQQSLPKLTGVDSTSSGYEQARDSAAQRQSTEAYNSATPTYQAKSLLHALNQREHELDHSSDLADDDAQIGSPLTDVVDEAAIKEAWDQLHADNDHILFGVPNAYIELATLHPAQAHIFKLWQIYLENVDPILKVTHAPSLQARIIDAAADVTNLEPVLEAQMFSIYCVALASLQDDQCSAQFMVDRKELLKGYSLGCQQALLRCNFLRSTDRDCLTALFLYLVSRLEESHRTALSSVLGIAMRVAQRMAIQSEAANANCNPFEGEMRRRLWWALVMFDDRISEMSDQSTSMLTPLWDCRVPLNINDSDIRPDMKTLPTAHPQPSDSILAAARSELNNIVRHSPCHLDLVNPALKIVVKQAPSQDLANVKLDELMERTYLRSCNPEIPLQFLTIWFIRAQVARIQLLDCHSKWSDKAAPATELERDTALSYALKMLECDTKLKGSSFTAGFRWHVNLYFPFPAYIWTAQELRKRPLGPHAEYSWKVMDEHYEVQFPSGAISHGELRDNPVFRVFAAVVLQAWEACERASKQANIVRIPARMVSDVKDLLSHVPGNVSEHFTTTSASTEGVGDFNNWIPTATNFRGYDDLFGAAHTAVPDMSGLGPWSRPEFWNQNIVVPNSNPFNWSLMDRNFGYN